MNSSTVFLLIFFVGLSYCTNPDDDLRIYLRGMKWDKVQEHLKEDLRLSADVVPTSYAIDLSVNVRGHGGAAKSDFNGTVTINLDIIKAVDKIELHSKGLIIENAEMLESLIMSTPLGVTQISSDADRETITVHLNRTIQTDEKFMLQIIYSGLARMDEYGLYENWAPKQNDSLDARGPFVLASMNYPTGARLWFPCFDEPKIKATFELQVNYPSGMNVYSNSDVQRTESRSDGRMISVFAKSKLMPTYQVALSINAFQSIPIEVSGFGKVRLVLSKYSSVLPAKYSDGADIDIPAFVKRSLEKLSGLSIGEILQNKIDIIILDGTTSNSVQPGLITFGRLNLWKAFNEPIPTEDFRDLTQLRVGNLITVQNFNDLWLNDMFSYALWNTRLIERKETIRGEGVPAEILHASLHERPLREEIKHCTSTKQYLTSRNSLPSLKTSQLIKILQRFCPSLTPAVEKYIIEQTGRFADTDDFIRAASESCSEPAAAREFLEDFIDQPGKALITVKRSKDGVALQQTRYHSTYFNSDLRDTKTRYTMPVVYSIDGHTFTKMFFKNETFLKIDVPATSIFLIDHEFDHLYLVFYDDLIQIQRNITKEERFRLFTTLEKSMIAAASIGYVKFDKIYEQMAHYVRNRVFIKYNHYSIYDDTKDFVRANMTVHPYKEATDVAFPGECEKWFHNVTSWNEMFNDAASYWKNLDTRIDSAEHIHCISQWKNATTYESFIEQNFLGENTSIRPNKMGVLARRSRYFQWGDLHRFFFRNAGNITHHRFDMLANTVLNQAVILDTLPGEYPEPSLRDDYLNELRQFVIRNPRHAASMSTEIEMRMEREFIREQLPKFHNIDGEEMQTKLHRLEKTRD